MTDERPSPSVADSESIGVHIGERLRTLRKLRKVSQRRLAEAVGLSYQMIQKYERGECRISAAALWRFSSTLDVPPSFFFDGIEAD